MSKISSHIPNVRQVMNYFRNPEVGRSIALVILFALPFGVWGITSTGPTPLPDRLMSFGYGLSNGLLFAAVLTLLSFLHRKTFQLLFLLILAVSYALALITVFYYLSFGFPFSSSSLIVILETNQQEAHEFLSSFNTRDLILFCLAFVLMQFILIKYMSTAALRFAQGSKATRWVLFSLLTLVYTLCILKNDLLFQDNMFLAIRSTYLQYQEERQLMLQQRLDFSHRNVPMRVQRDSVEGNETYLLVIGESLSRHHLSLYGYTRETNPELGKISDELMVFKDVISPDNTTVHCLKKILTFADCDRMDALLNKPDLLKVLNKAGFDTYWISNQCYSGMHDSWATLFSLDAKERFFTNFVNSYKSSPVYDEAVLDPLKQVLQKPGSKKFIIVHLIGSHKRADFRYPLAFSKFSTSTDQPLTYAGAGSSDRSYVNSYDNSVLYNDYILSEMISVTKSLQQKSFLLYFPDHGEEVCEQSSFSGHSDGMTSRYIVEIPVIFWQSDGFKHFRNVDPSVVNKPYQTEFMIHSILDLLKIRCDEYQKTRSVFDPNYQPEKRMVECRYDYDEVFGKAQK